MRRAELGVLGLLVAVGAGPLVVMLLHAASEDLTFAGVDGPFAGDQFQYLAWVREYGSSVLADNDLDLAPSDGVFLHPMFLLSGLLVRAGVSVELAFQLWKPVAVVVLFLGARAYARRFLPDAWQRVAALAVALLFASPAIVLVGDDIIEATGETFTASMLWGYLPTAIAVGLMPFFLLGAERLARGGSRRDLLAVAVCGALASWLHPWQGQVLLVTLVAGVLMTWRRAERPRLGRLAIAAAATLAPLIYYFVLSLADPAWELAAEVNESIGQPALWTVVVALAPLAAVALLGVRRGPWDLGEAMLLAWAPASLVVFLFLSPSFAVHALEGISIPLGVLAARALGRLGRPAPAAVAVAVLVVPGALYMVDWLRDTVEAPGQAHYLERGEQEALDHLDDQPEPGGVLTSARLGTLIPSATGRRSWVGHPSWTPDYGARVRAAEALLDGRGEAAVVRASGARFVLVDCGRRGTAAVAAIAAESRRFGCASVHRIAP